MVHGSVRTMSSIVAALIVFVLLVSACAAPPTSAPGPTQAPPATQPPVPTQAQATSAPAAPTAPQAGGPKVGGTLVWALAAVPDTYDPHGPGWLASAFPTQYLGSGLVARVPQTGEIVSYLADTWKISSDGLTYEFNLKKNAKFSDGTPVTAKDYVYTIQRAKDPATKMANAGVIWGSVASAEAPDDYTLVLKLSKPNATFLLVQATYALFAQPVPKQAIDKLGDKFAVAPVLSGPYKLKELQSGVKVVLERNPDFNWGPAWHPGPAYIQNIEFRAIKEYATILAGLESGEIDVADVQPKDVERLKATGKVQIVEWIQPGLDPALIMNLSKTPWDDLRVRKAVNLALDRQAMIKVAALGQGIEQKGPVAPSAYGYWPGVEQVGYGFDLNQAKALLKEAGYTPGSDGIMVKDGNPLKFTMKVWNYAPYSQVGQMIQQQLKALGIDVQIQEGPKAETDTDVLAGKFDLAVERYGAGPDASILFVNFLSSNIGATNRAQVKDPKLNDLIAASYTENDTAKRLDLLAQAQKLVVEQAYVAPLYIPKSFFAVSNRVKGFTMTHNTYILPVLFDAYIQN